MQGESVSKIVRLCTILYRCTNMYEWPKGCLATHPHPVGHWYHPSLSPPVQNRRSGWWPIETPPALFVVGPLPAILPGSHTDDLERRCICGPAVLERMCKIVR